MGAEVLIVGGGPVGLGLAIELGQRGVSVQVLERREVPQQVPKGQNLTQRTMEHMRHWGVEDTIRNAKTIPRGVGLGGLTAYGSLLSGYHYDWFKRASVAPYYHAENERLPQYKTEEVLRARVAELDSVSVRYGVTVADVGQDADCAFAVTSDGERFEGRYLVGCDGSHSVTRMAAGISETLRDHDKPMALLVFRSPEFFKLIERFPDKQFYNVIAPELQGYWMFFGMVDWGESFFFHAPVPKGTDRENFDFAGYLHRAVGQEFALELDYVGFWDLRIAYANSYRAGRIFIAGDAAHSHPPYGGYGINTGFEDARNLGWKLAAELQGWGGAGLLDSYDTERRPVFASTARDFIEKFIETDKAFLETHDPTRDKAGFEAAWAARAKGGDADGIASFVPNYAGSPIVAGNGDGPSALGEHSLKARVGHHLPPPVEIGEGAGLTLIGEDAWPFVEAAEALKVPLRCADVGDADYGAPLILLRPDGFVAWCGEEGEPAEILQKAIGWCDM